MAQAGAEEEWEAGREVLRVIWSALIVCFSWFPLSSLINALPHPLPSLLHPSFLLFLLFIHPLYESQREELGLSGYGAFPPSKLPTLYTVVVTVILHIQSGERKKKQRGRSRTCFGKSLHPTCYIALRASGLLPRLIFGVPVSNWVIACPVSTEYTSPLYELQLALALGFSHHLLNLRLVESAWRRLVYCDNIHRITKLNHSQAFFD